MNLEIALQRRRSLRVIGFDDTPFRHRPHAAVQIAGVVCANTRMEGLVWGRVRKDGWNANHTLCKLLLAGKFLPQLHAVLLDGIAFGGFNLIDLPALASTLERPCIAVMRRQPDLDAVHRALTHLSQPLKRLAILKRAGPIYDCAPFVFQVQGTSPEVAHRLLQQVTDQGHVPEALRLAHLIGAAVSFGESSRRA